MRSRVIGVLVGLASAACSDAGGGGGGGGPTTGSVRLTNLSSHTIHELHAVPWSSHPSGPPSSWDVAQNTTPIAPSGSFALAGLTPGTWDFRATIAEGESPYYAYSWGSSIVAGEERNMSVFNSDFTGSLRVTNHDGFGGVLTELYLRPTGASEWGVDHVSTTVEWGESRMFFDLPADQYEVKCVRPDDYFTEHTFTIEPIAVTSIACSG